MISLIKKEKDQNHKFFNIKVSKIFFLYSTELLLVLTIILISSFLFGCAEKKQTEIDIGLSWIHEAQYAGLYAADQLGYYEEEGLKVKFHPFNNEDLAQKLIEGKYDIVFLQTDSLFLAREKNLPVKAIFADYQIMPTVYFSKKEKNILKPEDFIGKTVGVAYSEEYPLKAMLKNAGIDIEEVKIVEREYTYDKLSTDEYDVEAGWVTDGDAVQKSVGNYNYILPYDYGVNWYADLICVREEDINDKPELFRSFLRATIKGWQYAIENEEEAALFTQKYEPSANAEHLKFGLKSSLPLIHTGDKHIGWMEMKIFEQAENIFLRQGIMKTKINTSEAYTTKFLEEIYLEKGIIKNEDIN